MLFSKVKKVKEIPFMAVLGDLDWNVFFVAQP